MPLFQPGGRFFDQMYQSRSGDFAIAPRGLEPRVPVGGVIDDQVDDHADATLVRLVHELDELAARAVARIDAVEVGDVVAVVAIRRGLERREPDHVDAERIQVVQALHQPVEVAAAVAVPVHERFQVEAVDDRVLVPEIGDHPPQRAWTRLRSCQREQRGTPRFV